MLSRSFSDITPEVGCDEAGRGCLAGPVVAAAVILPPDFDITGLDDSKKLSQKKREALRKRIEQEAIWCVAEMSAQDIDRVNILNASILAMHKALDGLSTAPGHIIVDGNKFKPYHSIPYTTIVKGDAKYATIAAASILAKTHRDEIMLALHTQYPYYDWQHNMGYPTPSHLNGMENHGLTPYHRRSYSPCRAILDRLPLFS